MNFTETGVINFSRPIYLPMPQLFIELFDAWEKLPEPDMVKQLLGDTSEWDEPYFEDFDSTLVEYLSTDDISVDTQEIDFSQILRQSYYSYVADKRFPKLIVSSDNMAIWLTATTNFQPTGLAHAVLEAYGNKDPKAGEIIQNKITQQILEQLQKTYPKLEINSFEIEEFTDGISKSI